HLAVTENSLRKDVPALSFVSVFGSGPAAQPQAFPLGEISNMDTGSFQDEYEKRGVMGVLIVVGHAHSPKYDAMLKNMSEACSRTGGFEEKNVLAQSCALAGMSLEQFSALNITWDEQTKQYQVRLATRNTDTASLLDDLTIRVAEGSSC